jgi:hypothetical protein
VSGSNIATRSLATTRGASAALGVLWLALALTKILYPEALRTSLAAMALGPLSPELAYILIVAFESLLGLALLAGSVGAPFGGLAPGFSLAYSLGLAALLLFGGPAVQECGCLGPPVVNEGHRKTVVLGCTLLLGALSIRGATAQGAEAPS